MILGFIIMVLRGVFLEFGSPIKCTEMHLKKKDDSAKYRSQYNANQLTTFALIFLRILAAHANSHATSYIERARKVLK